MSLEQQTNALSTDDQHEGAEGGALTGERLSGLFATAAVWLERNAQAINAINVFPVPDGDTGSNMAATLRDAVQAIGSGAQSSGEVTAALAHGALMSARGNSGVILSQILRGFAAATHGLERIDGGAWARALAEGAAAAYGSIEHPVEGTILTVARAAAEAAAAASSSDGRDVLEAALAGARTALARTPELLPVLRQAGVVDSGGLGFVVLLEGAVRYLRGESLPAQAPDAGSLDSDWLADERHRGSDQRFGYCTEFVVLAGARALDVQAVRRQVSTLGDSLVIAGDSRTLHVHVHTDDPGAAISFGTSLGQLARIKVDNMQLQHEKLLVAAAATSNALEVAGEAHEASGPQEPAAIRPFATVFVAAGPGLARAARELGAGSVVFGGQTMNPSVEEILRAVESAPGSRVIVLPNNGNVILTAEQAARLTTKDVRVVKTRSAPQGLTALLALDGVGVDDESSLDRAATTMQAAAADVRNIEVTYAARATRIAGLSVSVEKGQAIGLLDDEIVVAASSSVEALEETIAKASPAPGATVTLYYGEGVPLSEAEAAAARLRSRFVGVEVQFLEGGQPHYPFLASVE